MCNCFPCKIEFKNPFKEIHNYFFNSNTDKKSIHPLEKIIIDKNEYKEQKLENNIYYNPEFQEQEQKPDILYIEPDNIEQQSETKTSLYDEIFYTNDSDNQSYSSAGASKSRLDAIIDKKHNTNISDSENYSDSENDNTGENNNTSENDNTSDSENDSETSNNFSTTSSNWDILSD